MPVNEFGEDISPASTSANSAAIAQAVNKEMRLERAQVRGRGFVVSNVATIAGNGGTETLQLKNPSGSNVSACVNSFLINSQFAGEFAVYDAFSTPPSGGSDAGIDNLLMDAEGGPPDVGNMISKTGVSFTQNGIHVDGVLPSGGPGDSIGGNVSGTEPIIEPGREIVLELTNTSGSDEKGSLGVVYSEIDTIYSEEAHP